MIEYKLDQLKLLFSSFDYPLLFIDDDGKVLYKNKHLAHLCPKFPSTIKSHVNFEHLITDGYAYTKYGDDIYKWHVYEAIDNILVVFINKEKLNYNHLFKAVDNFPIAIYMKSDKLDYIFSNQYLNQIAATNDVTYKSDFDLCWHDQAELLAKNDTAILKSNKTFYLAESVEVNNKITDFISIKMSIHNFLAGASIRRDDIHKLYKILKGQYLLDVNDIELSDKEKLCLKWFIEGKTAYETGEILSISARTVEWHIRNIVKKLNLNEPKKLAYYLGLYFSEVEVA
ncbi:helix-turn-helix domain-containing protein [Thiotrichales bacterium 19X7-9]|nr:helix-turn-helix domain-containing protein [Thiotrichales bacterium 19X7-9]